MSKTRQNIRDHVRTYLDEVSEADWTDTQINREINYAYLEVVSGVIDVYEDYYRKKVSADLVANQSEYELPSDFLKMRRLEIAYTDGGDRLKATRYAFDSQIRAWDDNSTGSTSRPIYDLSGGYLRILPVPSASVTSGLQMHYIYDVSELSADTDAIDIPNPDRYGRIVTIGASAELLRKGQQEESVAAQYDLKFKTEIEKMKQELEDRIAEGSKMIVDTLGDWNDFGASPGFVAVYS